MARGKRVVSEVQRIHVKKYNYITDRDSERPEIVKREIVTKEKNPGVLSNLFHRKKKPVTGPDRVEDFANTLERE